MAGQPVVEPAQGLLVHLVERPVQVQRRPDDQLLRALPVTEAAERGRQVQAVQPPAGAEVRGHLGPGVVHPALREPFVLGPGEHDVGHERVRAARVLQAGDDGRHRGDLVVAERGRDRVQVCVLTVAVAVPALVPQPVELVLPVGQEPPREDAAVVQEIAVEVGRAERGEDRGQRRRGQHRHLDLVATPGKRRRTCRPGRCTTAGPRATPPRPPRPVPPAGPWPGKARSTCRCPRTLNTPCAYPRRAKKYGSPDSSQPRCTLNPAGITGAAWSSLL